MTIPPKPLDPKTAQLRAARLARDEQYKKKNVWRTADQKIYNLEDTITFGKYRGRTIEDIIDEDCEYIVWCLENIKWFVLSTKAESYLQEQQDPRRPTGAAYQ